MTRVDVLVLHGSPGSGKTTLSRAVSELLREADLAHAVVDLDDLSLVYPWPPRSFARDNLSAIWPNYAAIPDLRLILPTVIADQNELEQLRGAVPGARFAVCELTAPTAVLKERVTAREPNEFWRQRLRGFVDLFQARNDLAEIRDFIVSTESRSIAESAQEVIEKACWDQRETTPTWPGVGVSSRAHARRPRNWSPPVGRAYTPPASMRGISADTFHGVKRRRNGVGYGSAGRLVPGPLFRWLPEPLFQFVMKPFAAGIARRTMRRRGDE